MKIVSLFSGAGGLDLGLIFAGHEIIWANDFDKFAVESYNKNIGKFMNHTAIDGDIVKLLDTNEKNINKLIPSCDVIIGGFPCQGFTIANLDRNMNDERNHLYKQLLKVISVKQPKFFLLENVKGLENIEGGKVLNMILNDLEKCGTKDSKFFPKNHSGYTVIYNVLNALNYGVPENRERVIILGIRNNILDKTKYKDIILAKKNSKKYDERKKLYVPITHSQDSKETEKEKPNEIVSNLYSKFVKGKIKKIDLKAPKTIYKTKTMKDAIGDLPLEYDESIPNHDGSRCIVKIKNTIGNRRTYWDKEAPTIMGRGSGTGGPLIPPHPNEHRRLTVREVARIQTFPDDFIFYGNNSAGYRQIGNAVPVLLAFQLGKLLNHLEI